MKTRLFAIFLLSLFACFNLQADEIPVSPTTFQSEYSSASDGDVLLLETGTYAYKIDFPSERTITLKAAEGASPVFSGEIGGSNSINNGGLIFDNVEINRNSGYVINADFGNVKLISFRNLTITNVQRCLIRNTNTGYTIDKIELENCIVKECGTDRWNLIYTKHGVKEFTVKNSTLYNYNTGESFFCVYGAAATNVLNFVFEKNTVYNWSGATSGRALAKVEGNYNSESTYTFRNNIIAEHTGTNLPSLVDITAGVVIGENNLIVNYGGYKGGTQTINDLTLEGLGITTIGFPDPSNGNFTIASTSPIATAGTDGGPIGDPRWVKSMAKPVSLSTKIYPEGAGTVSPATGIYDSGEWAMTTATHNHGYRFKEWQIAGQTVSTENPYPFQIEEDTELTAVFNVIETYSLVVNKEGDGAEWGRFKLTPEPVDGKYEKDETVVVTIVPNEATSFLYWDDGSTSPSYQVTMSENKVLTATFDWIPFIVGWTFDPSEPRNNRTGDFYSRTDNTGVMKLFNGDGSTTNWGGNTKDFAGVTYTAARRYTGAADMNNPRYLQAEFSVNVDQATYKNIKIKSFIAVDNECVHKVQKMLYATNESGPFQEIASVDMTPYYNSQWVEFSAMIPDPTEDMDRFYIRWVGDTNSELIGTPGDGATEGFYLANVFVFGDREEGTDPIPPVLIASVPAEGSSSASKNGSIVLTFDKRVKAGNNDGKVEFNGETITPVFANKTVTYPYKNLSYGTQYTFTISSGSITNASGYAYEGKSITFSTMNRPQPTAKIYDAVVDINGTGDYLSIQDAIDNAPADRATPWLIFIKNGRYDELIRIPENKPYIHLIGQDKDNVIAEFKIHCGEATDPNSNSVIGVSDCSAVVISAPNFYAENISFENSWGVQAQGGPQAYAIYTNNDRSAFYNCKFRGYQDTWKTSSRKNNSDRTYVTDSWIEGAVDYIFGGGNIYVENTTLYSVGSGWIVAPSHGIGTPWGYVFNNCVIDGNEKATSISLGRPWQNEPIAIYLNTTMKVLPPATGWSEWGIPPKLFAEYNSVTTNGSPVDLNSRLTTYNTTHTRKAILTQEEAMVYTYENVVGGNDDWNPKTFFEPVSKPTNVVLSQEGELTWSTVEYAICYVVYKDNQVVGFTSSNSYEASLVRDNGQYKVQAVNEFGSLGEISEAAVSVGTSIQDETVTEKIPVFEKMGSDLIIKNISENSNIRMFTIDGRLIMNVKANSDTMIIPIQSSGYYLVKIGNYTCKIIL